MNDMPLPADARKFHVFALEHDTCPWFSGGLNLRKSWDRYGADIVAQWAMDHPGTRPTCWWRFSAPRLAADRPIAKADPEAWPALLTDLPTPRERFGGTGTPDFIPLCTLPRFHLGLPVRWITSSDIETYSLIGNSLDVPAIDPEDPPTFESQASYLHRLNLLLPGEADRLPADAFEPETIVMEAVDGDD
ncbi:hypothetical protein SAMN05660686_00495 [Thalassobaculum litoreum DSM 18839]|uniref:Uncharacterized protein n=2 Tax=Thalassobaculum TaxID=526215 RepID=A0A8G2BEC6_9PROT|nr:hypothetical protein SAMN05660686_00495 [Thalassobaculum litoreum DSM 18839]